MKSPIGVTHICVPNRKQTASFSIAGLMLAIAPLWVMLAAANTSACAQTSDNVSNASATTSTAPSPADWTEFHRDNMQRWNPYETVLNVNNVGSLQLKWKKPIGNYHFSLESSPAVVNGVVYFGFEDGNVYALYASTGATLWSYTTINYPTGGGIESSPTVVNGVVYIGGNNLYALDASTGALLWSYTTGYGVLSSPPVVNGVVYFGAGDDNVYALNASTGAKLWSSTVSSGPVFSSPAVANGVVYVSENPVYALNASTGATLWSYATEGDLAPAVANGVVYTGFSALNASTGPCCGALP